MTAIDSPRVLVTAGASGIGRVVAHAFAAQGARVWLTDVDEQALADCPANWHRERVDVADPVAMKELFTRIEHDWDGLDTLCANAGIAGATALLEDQDYTAFQQCLAVTLGGAVLAAQGAVLTEKRFRVPHILSIAFPGGMPEGLVEKLAAAGAHVAPRLGRIRISPHVYNDEADVDRFLEIWSKFTQ